MTTYEDDRTRRYFKDKALEADYKFLEKKLPGMEVDPGSSTRDERLWLVLAHSDTEPGDDISVRSRTRRLDGAVSAS